MAKDPAQDRLVRELERQDELKEAQHRREMRDILRPPDDMMVRRRTALLLAVMAALTITLGTFGTGIALVVTGVSRENTTFAALGVLLLIVAVLAASAGAWKIAGPGFEFSQGPSSTQELRTVQPSSGAAPEALTPRLSPGTGQGPHPP